MYKYIPRKAETWNARTTTVAGAVVALVAVEGKEAATRGATACCCEEAWRHEGRTYTNTHTMNSICMQLVMVLYSKYKHRSHLGRGAAGEGGSGAESAAEHLVAAKTLITNNLTNLVSYSYFSALFVTKTISDPSLDGVLFGVLFALENKLTNIRYKHKKRR